MKLAPLRPARPAATLLAVAIGAALNLAGPSALAQKSAAERIDQLERKLEQSLKQIEQLSKEVQQLRGTQPQPTAPAADADVRSTVTQQATKIEDLERQVNQISAANSYRGLKTGIPLHGFADVGVGYSRQKNIYQSGPKGFGVGSLSLYLTPELSERVKSLLELVFEVDQAGDLAVDLERVQLGYTFSDALTLWAGRYHTPYGYWNTAYHHGQQIQTSLSRPRFLEFEDRGGILPAHSVGLWATGTLPLGGARFNYDLYVANGPRIKVDPAAPAPGGTLNLNFAGDDNHSALVGTRLEFAPRGALDGLKLGAHALYYQVRDDSPAFRRTRVLTYGPYLAYTSETWEILGEYYRFSNRDLTGGSGTHTSTAWYAQAGYAVNRFTPYGRYERAALDQTDNYFAAQNSGRSYHRAALGVRYDLSNTAALKFEASRMTLHNSLIGGGDDRFNELRAQFAIRF